MVVLIYPYYHISLKLYFLCNVSGIPGAKTVLFNLKKCKNMLKIENRCCHGNGCVESNNIFLFITRQKLKTGKVSGKSILTVTENDF